jgi:hypothetical protein
MIQLKTILFSFILVMITLSTLQVYMTSCAVTEISNTIDYTLANFGHILYGRTIIGEIIIPKNE